MCESWPHAPPHYFTHHGTYIITAATLHRKPLFDSDTKLDLFRDTTLKFGGDYALILQAWAFFANHYHLVASFEHTKTTHRDFVRHLHRGGRARHCVRAASRTRNAACRGLPALPTMLRCSAAWSATADSSGGELEGNARSGFVKSVYSFKIDRIKVPDDF